jgi:hypothetical protein
MNIRRKLAAVTLAAGTVVAGGAALSMTAAQAAPQTPTEHVRVVPLTTPPTFTITTPPTLSTIPPNVTLPPRITVPKPTVPNTTPDPTTPATDHVPCVDCDPDWTGSTAQAPVAVDAPVKGAPAFTG